MNSYSLPTSLTVGGVVLNIRTDYRTILGIMKYFGDPTYTNQEKWMICLQALYKEPSKITNLKEAQEQAVLFLNGGDETIEDKNTPVLMDWEQDAKYIIPAVNKVAGKEVRALEYLHWWTFLGYYMEIGEGTFNTIVSIRSKKAKGKPLEKWEKEWASENAKIIKLRDKLSAEEKAEEKEFNDALDRLLGV